MAELLQAIKEKSVTLDTIRHSPHPLCKSPPAPTCGETRSLFPGVASVPGCVTVSDRVQTLFADSVFSQTESDDQHRPHTPPSHGPASPSSHPKPLGDTLTPKEPPSPAVHPDRPRGPSEGPLSKRNASLLNSLRPQHPLQAKEGLHSVNGRSKPWDSFTPEEFAQQFHESVLQSTQKALQKHKGENAPGAPPAPVVFVAHAAADVMFVSRSP